MITLQQNIRLKPFNTFNVQCYAKYFVDLSTVEEIIEFTEKYKNHDLPWLIIGEGSNILFTGDFEGIVIHINLKEKEVIKEDGEFAWIKAGAGVNWDEFVIYAVVQNLGGLENLSFIPGTVGATPVQNIGAYGVEVKDVIEKVEVLNIETGELSYISNEACDFSYRNSVFKNRLKGKVIILSVVYRLRKEPEVNISYKALAEEVSHAENVSINDVRNAVISIRKSKLPDPEKIGNAGSFFKNPVVSFAKAEKIKAHYPSLPYYKLADGQVKLSAAWLIEQCGWKGKRLGNAGVYEKQPLILVNHGKADGKEIIELAKKIKYSVYEQFSVELEPEVRIIGGGGFESVIESSPKKK